MDLMEYQAKELFAKHGVPVLPGETVDTADLSSATEVAVEHDPVELVKRGLGAEVVEEKPTSQ